MDLHAVVSHRLAGTRAELALAPGETLLAGGTWLFSQPQPQLRGLVDLTGLGWPDVERLDSGLRVAATCPIAVLAARPESPLFARCAEALLMSFKVQEVATVGGNLCLALPAGAMISLFAALGATAVLWAPDGAERRLPVTDFVRGVRETALRPGEVLRAVEVDDGTLAARAAFRRIALTDDGRSSSVVIGVATPEGVRVTVTAATPRPVVLEPGAGAEAVPQWYDDPHGAADWRHAVTAVLIDEVRTELGR